MFTCLALVLDRVNLTYAESIRFQSEIHFHWKSLNSYYIEIVRSDRGQGFLTWLNVC